MDNFCEMMSHMEGLEELTVVGHAALADELRGLGDASRSGYSVVLPKLAVLGIRQREGRAVMVFDPLQYRHLHRRYPALSRLTFIIDSTIQFRVTPPSDVPSRTTFLPSIEHLRLRGDIFQLSTATFLSSFNQLRTLALSGPGIFIPPSELLVLLKSITPDHLTQLRISNSESLEPGVVEFYPLLDRVFARFAHLQTLKVGGLYLGPEFLESLKGMVGLKRLVLGEGVDFNLEGLLGIIRGAGKISTLKTIRINLHPDSEPREWELYPSVLRGDAWELFERNDGTFGISDEWDDHMPLMELTWAETAEFARVAEEQGIEVQGSIWDVVDDYESELLVFKELKKEGLRSDNEGDE